MIRLLLSLVALVALVQPALAESGAAVLPLQRGTTVNDADAAGIRAAVAAAVPEALTLAEVDRKLAAVDTNCTTSACLERAGSLLEARRLIGGRLERDSDSWTLSLWVFDTSSNATLATVRDQCGACSLDQATEWAKRVVSRLLGEVSSAAASGRIEVRSTPSGAEVVIDGAPLGATDMTFGVAPGHHTVAVQLAGYGLEVREVDVVAGSTVRVEVQLERAKDVGNGTRPSGAVRVAKWATLGLAVAGLATGIALMAVDGHGTCETSFPGAECPERYATMAPGVTLTVVGAASAIASGYLFYSDSKSRNNTAAVLPTGAGIAAVFRFR